MQPALCCVLTSVLDLSENQIFIYLFFFASASYCPVDAVRLWLLLQEVEAGCVAFCIPDGQVILNILFQKLMELSFPSLWTL